MLSPEFVPSKQPGSMTTIRLRAEGVVQGVLFRASTCEQARALGLRGWVENQPDGSVHAIVHGPDTAVHSLIGWALEGPQRARVDRVVLQPIDNAAEFDFNQDFEVRR